MSEAAEPVNSSTPEPTPAETTPNTDPAPLVGAQPDPAPADPKPAADDAPADPAPEYTPLEAEAITALLPEGLAISEELMPSVQEYFTENQFSEDQVKGLIALQEQITTESAEAAALEWSNQQTEWQNAAKSDPDFGGDKLEQTLANVNAVVDDYGDDDLRGMLATTGAGNHPAMIRMLSKLHAALPQEPTPVPGNPGGGKKPLAERLFPGAN